MTNIVSFALFRHAACAYENPNIGPGGLTFYDRYIPVLIRALRFVYPDWRWRFHHDDSLADRLSGPLLIELGRRKVIELVDMGKAETLCGSMLWRIYPLWNGCDDTSYVICRDIDSLPTPRERIAVEQWVESKKDLHSINDNVSHCGLMGGMCGFHVGAFKEIPQVLLREKFPTFDDIKQLSDIEWNRHGADQDFLNRYIQPAFSGSELKHTLASLPQRTHPLDHLGLFIGAPYDVVSVWEWFEEYSKEPLSEWFREYAEQILQ